MILQGDVVWVDFPPPDGSAPAGRRPAVVVQHDRLNRSAIQTVVVVVITSNLRLAGYRGNVRLAKGEAGLPRPCIVNVTQIATVDRSDVLEKLGQLSMTRLTEIWEGMRLTLEPRGATSGTAWLEPVAKP